MYHFWYDYVKPKCGEKAKPCYLSTSNFIVFIKADDIDKGTAEAFKQGDTSNYELKRSLPEGKSKNVIDVIKAEIAWKIVN